MTDKDIKELFDVPHSTLWTWKTGKSTSYKKQIYNLLRAMTKEEVINVLNRLKTEKKEEGN